MRQLIWFPLMAFVVGCNIGGKAEKSRAASGAGSAGPATAGTAAADTAEVALTPLPLVIKVKSGGMGAMDMTMGDKQSVTVDIGDGASINISSEDRDLSAIKKSYQDDTALFPFKKWEKEQGNLAILNFESDGKRGYQGFSLLSIGGKSYLCKTTGLDGQPSVEVVSQHLEACKNVRAK